MIIDTHAHYDDGRFDEDRDRFLSTLRENNIAAVVNASAEMKGCRDTLELTAKFPDVYGMLGIHPESVGNLTEADVDWIKTNLANEKIVAVGEIGLDYYWDENPPAEEQIKWFRRFIQIAKEEKLPINVHSRDAAADTLKVMQEENAAAAGGIIHCYSYSLEMAKIYVDMGFYIGVGGVVTFKNGRKLKEVVENIPLDHLVVETDCPYLAPMPFRGERNDSSLIKYIIEEMAALKGVSPEYVEQITEENARKVYGL